MIEPKETEIDGRMFILSKVPAVQAREIFSQYVSTGLPKVGDYKSNEALMLKLMAYVAVKGPNGDPLKLVTIELINNHMPKWTTLPKIEVAMFEYNCDFFQNGRVSTFFQDIAQNIPNKISEILMQSLDRLSQAEARRSTS